MLQLERIYNNSAGETIRIDNIIMEPKRNNIIAINTITENHLDRTGKKNGMTYRRNINTIIMNGSGSDRDVTAIEVIGNYNELANDANFTYATWNSPTTKCDMTDLPGIGDSV